MKRRNFILSVLALILIVCAVISPTVAYFTANADAEGSIPISFQYRTVIEDSVVDWLKTVPDDTYDGLISVNVLDVVPPEIAAEIVREAARVVTKDAVVIIGLNFCMTPEMAAERGVALTEDGCLSMGGVLRLVSHTDAEWEAIFAPYFAVERLEYFAWPGEETETRRLFFLRRN